MRIRTRFRLRRWREGKVRPVQGNSPHDRLVSRWVFLIVKGAFATIPSPPLRCCHEFPSARKCVFEAWAESICPMPGQTQAWTGSHRLPPAAPDPSQRTCREEHALLIVQMSSGRLFLDRVARQHCPSPLHRQPDHKTVDRGDERIYYRTVTVSFPRVSP